MSNLELSNCFVCNAGLVKDKLISWCPSNLTYHKSHFIQMKRNKYIWAKLEGNYYWFYWIDQELSVRLKETHEYFIMKNITIEQFKDLDKIKSQIELYRFYS